jgi:hypothetical protein
MTAETMRKAFADQAVWCGKLGSPFTAALMRALPDALDGATDTARRVWAWTGDPSAKGDSVPLRLAGGLHALARSGRVPALTALYPPNAAWSKDRMVEILRFVIGTHDADLVRALGHAPQTNEVARSALLYPGLAEVARRTGRPLSLFEIGASAGLNLALDRFAYTLGGRAMGRPASAVHLNPVWSGRVPEGPEPAILERSGCDVAPIDVRDETARARLIGYVWPDQTERLTRIEAAVAIALKAPPRVERMDAADYVERHFTAAPKPGVARVLMHSIALQYVSATSRARVEDTMERAGRAATVDTPLAWLAFEQAGSGPELSLRLWPGGETTMLARADAHGRSITWLA